MTEKLPLGPWDREPDGTQEYRDEATGLRCRIWKHPTLGHLCGYVEVPRGSPLHGMRSNARIAEDDGRMRLDVLAPAHGGLTYSGEMGPDGTWWLGFDCGHAGDMTSTYAKYGWRPEGTYRTSEYVRGWTALLAGFIASRGAGP